MDAEWIIEAIQEAVASEVKRALQEPERIQDAVATVANRVWDERYCVGYPESKFSSMEDGMKLNEFQHVGDDRNEGFPSASRNQMGKYGNGDNDREALRSFPSLAALGECVYRRGLALLYKDRSVIDLLFLIAVSRQLATLK